MPIKGNNEYAYSIDISASGYIELQELRKDLYSNQYITADLETTKQHPTTLEIEHLMDRDYNHYIDDEIEAFEKLEYTENARIDIEDIKEEKEEVRQQEDEEYGPWSRGHRPH